MNSIKQVKKLFNELNYILLPQHKKRAVPLFFCGIISALLELCGITIILPFVQAITEPEQVMNNRFVKPVLEFLCITDSTTTLVLIGVVIIVLYILKNLYMIFYVYFQNAYASRVHKELSMKMLDAYMKRPYVYYTNVSYAEVSRGIGEDTQGVYNILKAVIELFTQILYFCFISVYIVVTEPIIAVGVVLLMMLTMGVMVKFFKPAVKHLGKKNMLASTERNSVMYQIVQGIKDIYVADRRDFFVKKYGIATEKTRRTIRDYGFVNAIPDRLVEGICVSGLIGIVLVRLIIGSDMIGFIPRLAVFAMAAFKMLPAIGGMTGRINSIIYALPRIDNTYNNMQEAEVYLRTLDEYNEKNASNKVTDDKDAHFVDEIAISNIYWKYDKAPEPTLTDVCMKIKKGECVGFVGPSGSGKTTLSDIILGLYRPQKGAVTMDGVDIFTIPHTWANIVSYVQQAVFLTDDTVRANVAFGLENADDDKIWAAIDRASLGDFVRSLPDGLDTMVGERGVKFSGGQRQRIAIARALYSEPEVLVLDEATAALDNETERAIMESIDSLQGQVTMIIVAHRLTTIKNCDKIYSIENGVAVEKTKEEVLGEA